MSTIYECDCCEKQVVDSSPLLPDWIREEEDLLHFCCKECQKNFHDEKGDWSFLE